VTDPAQPFSRYNSILHPEERQGAVFETLSLRWFTKGEQSIRRDVLVLAPGDASEW
jgi:hypothetical protein